MIQRESQRVNITNHILIDKSIKYLYKMGRLCVILKI